MQKEEEIFDIASNIHQGLEPLIFTIIISNDTSTPEFQFHIYPIVVSVEIP